jgi:transketolase
MNHSPTLENTMSHDLDQQCINTLRFLSVDMVQKANSGHPGLPLDAAPMAYVLWTKHMKYHPADPHWADRDRFVLSAGHGSALLYSLLHVTGYDVSLDDIKQFRQWGSKTAGHPEYGHTPGVEVTTGPLGQGMANAVGMAIGEAQLAATYNREGHSVIDHRTWAIVSDGDLMEGVASEAASLAGHLKLGKLVCLYDDNYVTLAAGTDITFSEDRAKRFEAYGWQTIKVDDGNDVAAIDAALDEAVADTTRPTLILVRTHIGYGSPKQDSFKAHGSPLGVEDVKATKEKLGWPLQPEFLVPEPALKHFREALERGTQAQAGWNDRLRSYAKAFPEQARELEQRLRGELPKGWDADIPTFAADAKGMATREAGGKIMNAIAPKLAALFGGSADLDSSTFTNLKGFGDFNPAADKHHDTQGSDSAGWSDAGRNLHFGVREHAMGAIVNGLAVHGGFIPYGATFLVFMEYARNAVRMAALMKQRVIFVYTHDSIGLGEDGPTHQPIEQLANLRSTPNMNTWRPCDAVESAVAWKAAVMRDNGPSALIFSRQGLPAQPRTSDQVEDILRGGYVPSDCEGEPELILIATGSEVELAMESAEALRAEKRRVRVVSMPCTERFDAQDKSYRDSVLPPSVRARIAIEAAHADFWFKYVGFDGAIIAMRSFGESAPAGELFEHFGFTVEKVIGKAKALI